MAFRSDSKAALTSQSFYAFSLFYFLTTTIQSKNKFASTALMDIFSNISRQNP